MFEFPHVESQRIHHQLPLKIYIANKTDMFAV